MERRKGFHHSIVLTHETLATLFLKVMFFETVETFQPFRTVKHDAFPHQTSPRKPVFTVDWSIGGKLAVRPGLATERTSRFLGTPKR